MKLLKLAMMAGFMAAAWTSAAQAISVTPSSNPGVAVSSPFGPLAPGGALGTNYINFGIDFSFGNIEGIFNDPPLAFGGVNGSGIVDLVSPVDGRIVVAGTTNQGVTNSLYAEAGYADDGSLKMEVFDTAMVLLASVFNGPPLGANGRTTFLVNMPGIAFFRISGADTFGVNEFRLNDPTGNVSPVPVPAALPLLATALGGLGFVAKRRRKAT